MSLTLLYQHFYSRNYFLQISYGSKSTPVHLYRVDLAPVIPYIISKKIKHFSTSFVTANY